MNDPEPEAIEHAQEALTVAKAWLDHYTNGGPEPAWPLSDFDTACEAFFDALRVSGWLSPPPPL